MLSRRGFFHQSAGILAVGGAAPAFWQRAAAGAEPRRDATVLVVIELSGGNDGLNTVIPYTDDVYQRRRPTLRVEPGKVLKLDDRVGLHPALKDLHRLWEAGRLAVVQSVGYPNPNRSHLRSMEIWQTATIAPARPAGWLGRASDLHSGLDLCHVGQGTVPLALQGRKAVAQSIDSLAAYRLPQGAALASGGAEGSGLTALDEIRRRSAATMDLAQRIEKLPGGASGSADAATLDGRLETIRRLIEVGTTYRVYYTSLDGFDTHASQLYAHPQLLQTLGRAMAGFLDRLKSSKLDERVLVLVYSEFGRRLGENANGGTDHGTAAPVLVAGSAVKPGLRGPHPNLVDLDETGDPRFAVDFREVYASLLGGWLHVDPVPVLGERNQSLALT
jgi:uncharacterized protein (DUF1501 family)